MHGVVGRLFDGAVEDFEGDGCVGARQPVLNRLQDGCGPGIINGVEGFAGIDADASAEFIEA